MTTLADGRPALSGGFWWANVYMGADGRWAWDDDRYEQTVEVFDPVTGVWTQSPPMTSGRAAHVAVALADNSLLVAGGYFAGLAAERFVPGPAAPRPAAPATPAPRPALASYLTGLPRTMSVSRAGQIKLRLRCTGPGSFLDSVVLRQRNGAVLAKAKLAIRHGRASTLLLKLKRSTMRRLADRRTKVTLELTNRRLSSAATVQVKRAPAAGARR